MARAVDLAAYIVTKFDELGVMKLHRLAYYCQAWSLVWDEKPLFTDDIEAWCNGPVIVELFRMCDDRFVVDKNLFLDGDMSVFNDDQRKTIDIIIESYGKKSSQWLCDMVMSEEPWKTTRLTDTKKFSLREMVKYYRSIMNETAEHLKSGEFSRDHFDEAGMNDIHNFVVSSVLKNEPKVPAKKRFVQFNVGPETLRSEIGAQVMGFSSMVPFALMAELAETDTYEDVYLHLKDEAFQLINSRKKLFKK